jgi:hypothetical protein
VREPRPIAGRKIRRQGGRANVKVPYQPPGGHSQTNVDGGTPGTGPGDVILMGDGVSVILMSDGASAILKGFA